MNAKMPKAHTGKHEWLHTHCRGSRGASATYHATLANASDATERVVLTPGSGTAADKSLPAAKLTVAAGVWSQSPDWSAPALLIGPDHPLRVEMKHQLGALAAVAAGFMATLRNEQSISHIGNTTHVTPYSVNHREKCYMRARVSFERAPRERVPTVFRVLDGAFVP